MDSEASEAFVIETMELFARNTGLSPPGSHPQRYLWTDAFAVCNFLELYRSRNDKKYRQLALDLVDQVHETLGRHRDDDTRTGWISGLGEKEGRLHPTSGGLRIGKELPERQLGQQHGDRLEWDRDGQYYHYLTKWMHALYQVSKATGEPVFNKWACELAKTAHEAFVYQHNRRTTKRMYWKMNIGLTKPVVASMGQHDPLDGFVTYAQISRLSQQQGITGSQLDLTNELAELGQICRQVDWTTDDPLGIGGLLFDGYRLLQLLADEEFDDYGVLPLVLESSLRGLQRFMADGSLNLPANHRLAFRELGLSIGLRAVSPMLAIANKNRRYAGNTVQNALEQLNGTVSVSNRIETYWLQPLQRQSPNWRAHENINMVMLATSLAPAGFLSL